VDCTLIEPELVGFHFATLDEAARARVEEHLLGCKACLSAFVALKRAIESEAPIPSETSRARLRAAVAARIKPRPLKRWVWLGSAAAAVAAAFVLGTMYGTPPSRSSSSDAIDSARAIPASFNVL
jgi:anti-sigma factor RsiW